LGRWWCYRHKVAAPLPNWKTFEDIMVNIPSTILASILVSVLLRAQFGHW
jgi:hypothetical protein